MSEYSLRLAKPHCDSCHKPKGVSFEDLKGIEDTVEVMENVVMTPQNNLTLAERLQQALHKTKTQQEEEEL